MSIINAVDDYQRRHPKVGFPLAVAYKYFDDGGGYLAALITYYAFVSLFPLLLLASTVLGLVLDGNPGAQREVLHSALSQFPVVGSQLGTPGMLKGGTVGVLAGVLGALYGGLGVGNAAQNAMNTAWAVPRNNRPNPLKARLRGLVLLLAAGLGILATTALTALSSGAESLGGWTRLLTLIASIVLNAIVLTLAFRVATARDLELSELLPGALSLAVIWQLLQLFGATYVRHVVKGASDVNGVFALVLGLIAFLYIAAVAMVISVELNVVHARQLYPRALLTPLTDDVDLTEADERAYTGQAKAQRSKGFQQINVRFNRRRKV